MLHTWKIELKFFSLLDPISCVLLYLNFAAASVICIEFSDRDLMWKIKRFFACVIEFQLKYWYNVSGAWPGFLSRWIDLSYQNKIDGCLFYFAPIIICKFFCCLGDGDLERTVIGHFQLMLFTWFPVMYWLLVGAFVYLILSHFFLKILSKKQAFAAISPIQAIGQLPYAKVSSGLWWWPSGEIDLISTLAVFDRCSTLVWLDRRRVSAQTVDVFEYGWFCSFRRDVTNYFKAETPLKTYTERCKILRFLSYRTERLYSCSFRVSMNETKSQSSKLNPLIPKHHVNNPVGVAVDWVNDHLYWTEYTTRKISVSYLNGSYPSQVTDTGDLTPRSIAVHPGQG